MYDVKWPAHCESLCPVYLLVFSMNSVCYVADVSTVVLIFSVFASPYLCPPCLLCVCMCVCVCVCEMMPQLQDHTAGVPYRGPCLSQCIIFWQVDCMYGTESAPCSLGLTPIEFSLWDSWSKCRVSTVTCSSTCQAAVNKVDRDMVWQGYRWDRCSILRGVHVE
jgi:hypothetical protein